MIGVTLGADSSSSWTTLFIVIIFHQFFEGAALGARLALLHWLSHWHSFLQASMFMVRPDLSIADHRSSPLSVSRSASVSASRSRPTAPRPLSPSAFLTPLPPVFWCVTLEPADPQLYTSFKLLAADFVDGPLKNAPKKSLFASFLSLFLGILAMTILGRWV
jgi:zinc transporter 1/2/3